VGKRGGESSIVAGGGERFVCRGGTFQCGKQEREGGPPFVLAGGGGAFFLKRRPQKKSYWGGGECPFKYISWGANFLTVGEVFFGKGKKIDSAIRGEKRFLSELGTNSFI